MQWNLKRVSSWLTDLFYPARCPCCGEFIDWDREVCETCRQWFEEKRGSCPRCGRTMGACLCTKESDWKGLYCLAPYEGAAKQGIYSLKNSEGKAFGLWCGRELGRLLIKDDTAVTADIIVPVPMRRSKRLARGYNQAELIARGIREVTGAETDRDSLRKRPFVRDLTQHSLGAEKRFYNADKMYIPGRVNRVRGKNVILCDDVLTTGATASACTRLLKEMGAETVTLAVCAVTVYKDSKAGTGEAQQIKN